MALAALGLASVGVAQEKKSPLVGPLELLWPKGAPLARGEEEIDRPSLSVYLAREDKAVGAGVVVCPGGGYGHLAKGHEGHEVALFLNELGISAFVLSYRVAPKYHHPCPMLDVQRAVRTVRARAAEWKLDPARVGVMGFSAGGHLAATALTHFDDGKADAEDPIEKVGCRPDFGVLVYPYIVLDKPYTHQGAKKNLLGPEVENAALVEDLSPEKRVTPRTPPCFLIGTSDDSVTPPDHPVEFYLALRRAKVPAELHLYERGRHGFGLAAKDPVLSTWTARLAAWLDVRGLLKRG
jgi:acetyl esterase/lipase